MCWKRELNWRGMVSKQKMTSSLYFLTSLAKIIFEKQQTENLYPDTFCSQPDSSLSDKTQASFTEGLCVKCFTWKTMFSSLSIDIFQASHNRNFSPAFLYTQTHRSKEKSMLGWNSCNLQSPVCGPEPKGSGLQSVNRPLLPPNLGNWSQMLLPLYRSMMLYILFKEPGTFLYCQGTVCSVNSVFSSALWFL